jgi:DNA-binding response OmpR family regulator
VINVYIEISENIFSLSVTDRGIGIPKDQINNIFKLYYQVSSKNQSEGTGIGLAYVKELVEYMGGKVDVISAENVGTKMIIMFPVEVVEIVDYSELRIDIPKINKKNWNEEFITQTENEEERSSVLIVEDNDELRLFIADLLKVDYHLYMADNGINGLNAAFEYTPDVIVSDVMMPELDGFEMCATLKSDERTSHIPIILLTAKDSAQSNLEGYQTGADDYIIKPFENEILRLKLRNIIATREAARKQFDFKSIHSFEQLKLGNTDREFIKKCFSEIEKNIDNQVFGVDQLAEELAFSTRNFYRKIKSLTNQTPAELIRIYRLQYAKNLVQNTNMRVYEIADAVGYDDVKRFSQAFKKQFDKLPSEMTGNAVS